MENKYLKIAGNIHLSYFVEAAEILGIEYEVAIPNLSIRFKGNGNHWYINNTVTPLVNAPSAKLAKTKNFTNMILKDFGIPVPTQKKLDKVIDAISFFGQYKDIVVKPAQNIGGKGITILPSNEQEVLEAYNFAKSKDKHGRVLGEEFISGQQYRVLILGDKVLSVVHRIPARVIGDGTSPISLLIEKENEVRKSKGLMPITIDNELLHKIKSQGLTLESLIEENKEIQIRSNANMTTGGTTKEVLETIDPYYTDICIKAAKALDLEYAGIDLITPDISKVSKCVINEVNYNPGLRIHYKLDSGKPQKVAIDILKYIAKKYSKRNS